MTDPSVHDLHYGHFGPPVYDADNRIWAFSRAPGRPSAFCPLGHRELLLEAPASRLPNQPAPYSEDLQHQQKQLLSLNPELRAASSLLPRDAQISAAVCAVVSKHDALRGDLLAFGRAADVDNKGSKGTVRIAVLPGGAAGESLRLVQLLFDRCGWRQDKSIWLKAPTLSQGETGWWPGIGAPIQQVCCACQNDDRSTYIAARTSRSVHLFQPLFHRHPVPPSHGQNWSYLFPSSRLQASPLANIVSRPDAPAFTDVTFNPWYQRQFATLDEAGHWLVYDIEGRRGKRWDYRTVQTKIGWLKTPSVNPDANNGNALGHFDGWGRILWVKDVSTLLVCNRRLLQFTDFQGRSASITATSLRLSRSSAWILDVRRDARDSRRIVVLTSTHVFLLKAPLLADGANVERWIDADILISWRHFRDPEDTTLQTSLALQGESTMVLLRSMQDSVVTAFTYRQHEDTAALVSTSDPTEATGLLLDANDTSKKSPVVGIHVEALDYGEDPHALVSGPGREYRDNEIQFYGFMFLSVDLEVSRRLSFAFDPASEVFALASPGKLDIEAPAWTKRITNQSSTRVLDDDFLVFDGLEDADDVPPKRPWQKSKSWCTQTKVLHDSVVAKTVDSWTVDNTRICRLLNETADTAKEDSLTVISQLAEALGNRLEPDNQHNDTLWHLTRQDLDVADIDETASSFEDMVRSAPEHNDEGQALAIRPIHPAFAVSVVRGEDGVPSMTGTYDFIMNAWLATLPKNTPGRVRLASERLARRVAAELCLSSVTLRLQQPDPQHEAAEAGDESQLVDESGFSSPMKSFGRGKGRASRESLPFSSSQSFYGSLSGHSSQATAALPTPEATPSLSSGTSLSSSMSTLADATVSRLRQYTTFSKQQPALPRQMTRLLSHWTPGADPSSYNWEAARTAARQMEAMEDEGMSEKKRAKLFRKAERKLRKQRRETEAYMAQSASQQTPLLVPQPRSSPGPGGAGLWGASSQMPATSSQVFPSTQVERGAHGGRAKKRRRRTEGF